MRIKSRWKDQNRERSIEEIGSALAFIDWRIAGNVVLNLENEEYQVDTYLQRLQIIIELLAFLVSVTDRLAYEYLTDEQRRDVITGTALHLKRIVNDNSRDLEADFGSQFIDTLNARMGDYARFGFTDQKPDFDYLHYLGTQISAIVGPRYQTFILDQVMEIEGPEAVKTLRKGTIDLFPTPIETEEGDLLVAGDD